MMSHAPNEAQDHGVLPLLMSMISTRVELAALDTEAHVQSTLVALMTTFVAVVMSLIAFAFIGVTVIVLFWDTHRAAATLVVLTAYLAVAAGIAFRARSLWTSRPPAFAATLRELELDRAAFRTRS